MPAAKQRTPKTISRLEKSKTVYRGVHLQAPAERPRFTISQLKSAVEAAIAKNADAITGKV